MRPRTPAIGLAVTAAVISLTAAPAHAAPGLVDGNLSAFGYTCTFANATTSDTPPNTLTVDRATVVPHCGGDISVTLANSPTITFDDTAGTASAARIEVSAGALGITCRYRVSDVSVTRDGTTRTYTGGPFAATKVSGSFLCPAATQVDTATFTFH
ncbi:hypothetical protein ACGFNU_15850 [Spirillospora sp. NPDC048911]|uniref:hypothetical protein n=1 Tax=Spirillospora sp. NPDC048911 TaxID=3364527 RepID=UPI00372098B9